MFDIDPSQNRVIASVHVTDREVTPRQISRQETDKNPYSSPMHDYEFIISNEKIRYVNVVFLFYKCFLFCSVSSCAFGSKWEVKYGGWQGSKIAGGPLHKAAL